MIIGWSVLALCGSIVAQDHELAWRLRKGDSWVEHRRNEYVTTEGKVQRRNVIETEMEYTVDSDAKDGEATLVRMVRAFALTVESPEGKADVAYEKGAWKKAEWGDLGAAEEHYKEFVEHPPKLVGKTNGSTRSLNEVEGEVLGVSPHDPALLPDRRVKVGDEWTVPEESEGLTEFKVALKLEEVQPHVALLKMTMTLPEHVESAAGEATVQGAVPIAVELDLEEGFIRSQKGSGEFVFTRADPAGGAPIKTRLQMSLHTTRKRR